MKSTLFLIIAAIAACAIVYYIYAYFKRAKKRVLNQDPKAQKEYALVKHKKEEEKEEHLSLEEKVAKSWEFLTRITRQVLEKFSKQDQAQIKEASHKMVKHGMIYHHDIELEIKQVASMGHLAAKKRGGTKETSR